MLFSLPRQGLEWFVPRTEPRIAGSLPQRESSGAHAQRRIVDDAVRAREQYDMMLVSPANGDRCTLLRDCYVRGVGPRPAGAMCLGAAFGPVPDHLPYE